MLFMVLGCVNRTAWGYQAAPHGGLGLPGGLYQFMALTEGTPLPFESEWVLANGNITYKTIIAVIFSIVDKIKEVSELMHLTIFMQTFLSLMTRAG